MGVRGLFIKSGWIALEDTMAASGQDATFSGFLSRARY